LHHALDGSPFVKALSQDTSRIHPLLLPVKEKSTAFTFGDGLKNIDLFEGPHTPSGYPPLYVTFVFSS